MRTYQAIALVAALSPLGDALNLVRRNEPSAVRATMQRRPDVNPLLHDRRRREVLDKRQADTVSANLANAVTLYYINVTLGTPAQSFALHIDTGSSDLWVNTASSRLCQQNPRVCAATGTYSSSASTTYKFINNDFNVTYADGSAALGPYVSDTLTVGSTTLQNFQFGIGQTSSSAQGILGIGYPSNEGVVQTSTSLIYPNLPKALQNAGDINSNAYSLWLDDLDSSSGTILFGGVDTAKYTAPLVTLPIVPTYGIYSELLIALTGVGVNGNANSLVSNQAVAALLDSGTSLTYLPNAIVNSLYSEYSTSFDSRAGAAPVPCSLANQQGSVVFSFSGLTITVPLNELVINISNDPNAQVCAFGIAPAGSNGLSILGDTFLRSAYVVYDLSNNQISMAQTDFNASSSNILEIQSGANGVPSATLATNAVTSVQAGLTGAVGNIGPTSISVSATSKGAAAAMQTPAPMWKYGSGLAAGAAALAML